MNVRRVRLLWPVQAEHDWQRVLLSVKIGDIQLVGSPRLQGLKLTREILVYEIDGRYYCFYDSDHLYQMGRLDDPFAEVYQQPIGPG